MADKEEKEKNLENEVCSDEKTTVPSNPESSSTVVETPEAANSNVNTEDDNNIVKPPTTPTVKEKKIEVLLKATGDAPIMAKKKWVVSPDQTMGWISEFIKKMIKMGTEERLFLYINQTFAPAPDQTVRNLYECYGTDGKLIIHYCKSQAWG